MSLRGARVAARLPAVDLDRARRFYAEVLGLQPAEERPGGLLYHGASGSFALYAAGGRPSGLHTQMAFEVDDLDRVVAELRGRGLEFEHYDDGPLATTNGIAHVEGNYPSKGTGERAAWFRDSEGNLLGIGEATGAPASGTPRAITGRPLVLKLDVSLDGLLATEDGDVSWAPAGFDAELTAVLVAELRRAGTHVMGRGAYDAMAEHWMRSDEVFAPPMNETPKVVFSSTLTAPRWQGTEVDAGDLTSGIERLKQEPGGPLLAHGGARFARSLLERDLVDELVLLQHPIALGSGLPLFCDEARFERTQTRTFATGVVLSRFVAR